MTEEGPLPLDVSISRTDLRTAGGERGKPPADYYPTNNIGMHDSPQPDGEKEPVW